MHPPTGDTPEHESMRQRLAQGTLLAALRAAPPAGVRILSDAELQASLDDALRQHDPAADLHVFGYGSLMWNPALDTVHACVARVPGWHRRYCLKLLLGRGTAEDPGAMLALDRGGSCHGLLLRIAAAKVRTELRLLWRREMLARSYEARWIAAHAGGQSVRALTFIADRRHERYIGDQPVDYVARLIRTGKGPLGTSRAYFDALLETLARHRIRDSGMDRLRRMVLAADRAGGQPAA